MGDSCCCLVCVRTQEVGVVEGKKLINYLLLLDSGNYGSE